MMQEMRWMIIWINMKNNGQISQSTRARWWHKKLCRFITKCDNRKLQYISYRWARIFLHQPQAKILGNELPDLLGDRQAFIATHSEALIRGLLEVASERIKLYGLQENLAQMNLVYWEIKIWIFYGRILYSNIQMS